MEQALLPLVRMASAGAEVEGKECTICFDLVRSGVGHLRLGCRCLMHHRCFVRYIRSQAQHTWKHSEGLPCPNAGLVDKCELDSGRKYIISPDSLMGLVDCVECDEVAPLTIDELEKFRCWARAEPPSTGHQESCDPFILATTKACPGCGCRATHYHGHACHHIKDGCPDCKVEYCYACGSTSAENERIRGEEYMCKCEEGWSSFCCVDDSIVDNIVCAPYPCDKRCGCPICPDCRKDSPCEMCNGDCAVCSGHVPPGPPDLSSVDSWNASFDEIDGPLFAAVKRNDMAAFEAILCSGVDINECGANENTIFMVACARGRYSIAESLLNQYDVNIFASNNSGRTAFMLAAMHGHVDILKLILGREEEDGEIDMKQTDYDGYTAMMLAVYEGQLAVAEYLLSSTEIDLCLTDPDGRSLLTIAATRGHPAIVRLLLENGAEFDAEVLFSAVTEGQIEVVDVLSTCAKDAFDELINESCSSDDGSTALMLAAGEGHERIVQFLLLRSDIDINKADDIGDRALMRACGGGFDSIVRLFLARPEIDINLNTKEGMTALMAAAQEGRDEVVKLLLAHPDIDAFRKDESDDKDDALTMAFCADHLSTVSVFIETYSPSDIMTCSRLVGLAVENNSTQLIEKLIAKPGFDINLKMPPDFETMLAIAAGCGQLKLVERFLTIEGIDVNSPDNTEDRALIRAAAFGHYEVVKVLLERHDLCVNSKTDEGMTALMAAAQSNFIESLKLLLARADIDVNCADKEGDTALIMAVLNDHPEAAKLILGRSDTNVNHQGHSGKSALIEICTRESEADWSEVIGLLLARSDVDPNYLLTDGSTPVIRCLQDKKMSLAKVFVSNLSTNLTMRNSSGQTALSIACLKEDVDVLKILLRRPEVKAQINDYFDDGRTLLDIAKSIGCIAIVQCLLEHGANDSTSIG